MKITRIDMIHGISVHVGEEVLRIIDEFDRKENHFANGQRKKVKPKDSVGGVLGHKIFRWQKTILDNEVRYLIWRIQ